MSTLTGPVTVDLQLAGTTWRTALDHRWLAGSAALDRIRDPGHRRMRGRGTDVLLYDVPLQDALDLHRFLGHVADRVARTDSRHRAETLRAVTADVEDLGRLVEHAIRRPT